MKIITLLNTSILTTYGTYYYKQITLETARELVKYNKFQSAIGHQSTANMMTILLGVKVLVNRVFYQQKIGEMALVFKLNGRPEEGKVLTREDLEDIGFEWGLLVKEKRAQ